MPGVLWKSEADKAAEWKFAKEQLMPNGQLKPNGTKLRRKSFPDNLSHSFMIIDGRIIAVSGKGVYLGKGLAGHAKLAEDEAGNIIALKIITNDGGESNSLQESQITYDLGISGQRVTRTSDSKASPQKHYIAYQYLGISLLDYISKNLLSLDRCYELCIKISLALHEIHQGKKSNSKVPYQHNDIQLGNLVIDEQGEPHFIDFGRATKAKDQNKGDIVSMLLLFFTPIKDRSPYVQPRWIFGDWMGEYKPYYSEPPYNQYLKKQKVEKHAIYIYVEYSKVEIGKYPQIHYMVQDPEGTLQKGEINIDDLNLATSTYTAEDAEKDTDDMLWLHRLEQADLSLIRNKVLEVASQNKHIISSKNRNETLFNLLQDPKQLLISSEASEVPSALDIAATLNICRFNLKNFKITGSPDERLKIIHILNSISTKILALYEEFQNYPDHNNMVLAFQNQIMSNLMSNIDPIQNNYEYLNKIPSAQAPKIEQEVKSIMLEINKLKLDVQKTTAKAPPTEVPPTEVPPTEVPKTEAPKTDSKVGQEQNAKDTILDAIAKIISNIKGINKTTRFTTSQSANKIKLLEGLNELLKSSLLTFEKQELQVFIALCKSLVAIKRNPFGIFSPHSTNEFEDFLVKSGIKSDLKIKLTSKNIKTLLDTKHQPIEKNLLKFFNEQLSTMQDKNSSKISGKSKT